MSSIILIRIPHLSLRCTNNQGEEGEEFCRWGGLGSLWAYERGTWAKLWWLLYRPKEKRENFKRREGKGKSERKSGRFLVTLHFSGDNTCKALSKMHPAQHGLIITITIINCQRRILFFFTLFPFSGQKEETKSTLPPLESITDAHHPLSPLSSHT